MSNRGYKTKKTSQMTKDISSKNILKEDMESPSNDMGLTFGDMGFKVQSALKDVQNAVDSVN